MAELKNVKKSTKYPYRLQYKQYGTAEEVLQAVLPLIEGPLRSFEEMNDCYLSDYQKLLEASNLIRLRNEE